MDIYDKGYAGHLFLYIFCGILDSMWQTTAYWMMGAMSNDPARLAYFSGFCKYSNILWQPFPFERPGTKFCIISRQIHTVGWGGGCLARGCHESAVSAVAGACLFD